MKTFTAYRPAVTKDTHNELQANPPHMPQYWGVVFPDGRCALRWCTARASTSNWDSLSDALDIHGHSEYGTYVVWDDGRVENYVGDGKFEPKKASNE